MSKTTPKDKEKETGEDATDTTDTANPPPFFTSATITTKHGKSLNGCAIKPSWRKTEEDRNKDLLAAAVGNEFVYIYRLPADRNCIELLNTITFKFMVDPTMQKDHDELYRVAWVCDEIDNYSSKIVTAGKKGLIYVVNVVDNKMKRVLEGNRGEINDIRTNPSNPGMFATASTDFTVRVWHIRAKYCLVIFNNPAAHVSKILSVDWSPDGRSLFSGGFDHRIVCWNLSEENVKSHLKKCYKRIKAGRSIENIKDELNMDPRLRLAEKIFDPHGHTLIVKTVNNLANEIHFDRVDSLRIIGFNGVKYIISKSAGERAQLKVWRFGTWGDVVEKKLDGPLRAVTHLDKKNLAMSEDWFTKMDVDLSRKWVATAGEGLVVFFNLKSINNEYVSRIGTSQLRQAAFSENGKILLAVGEEGVVARFDRNEDFIQNNLLQSLSLEENNKTDTNEPSTSKLSVSQASRQFNREDSIDEEDMYMPSTSGTANRFQPPPIDFLDYELDHNRPSTSGPTTCGPSRKVPRCYLRALRSIDEGNSQDPVNIDQDSMPMETAPSCSLKRASRRQLHSSDFATEEGSRMEVKFRREESSSTSTQSTNRVDENTSLDRAPVEPLSDAFSASLTRTPMSPLRQDKKAVANAKPSSRNSHDSSEDREPANKEYSPNSDREHPHRNRTGTEKDRKDDEVVGRRISEATEFDQQMHGSVASSTGRFTNDIVPTGTTSNQTVTRGRSRGRPLKIRYGWQRSNPHVNNTRPSSSGQPGSQQPRRGVGRPRWSGRQVQVPRSSLTTINLPATSSFERSVSGVTVTESTRGPGRPRRPIQPTEGAEAALIDSNKMDAHQK
ncbi:hypothetical protein L3Y34_013390 [Caenorhabditis briggsae]|uniref:Protein CBR-MES-6 n=1 Tax=Caenorhabditis briggsae TaxID=6238 RepID=A0AAE8ZV24_CAEBR|nr:hypothetical protein L3Y34_013390 [Caenorhabditis briggsae]